MLEVAGELEVNERTVYRWLEREDVTAALKAIQRESTARTVRILRSKSQHAVNALAGIMADGEAAPSARVSAAKAVLDSTFRADELERLADIEARLDALEGRGGGREILS